MSRRHKRHHDDHEDHPSEAWLIALADMMTLLMVTFLMMFAIAVVDLQKFKTFARAFSEATGQNLPTLVDQPSPEELHPEKLEISQPAPTKPLLDRDDLKQLKQRVEAAIAKAKIGDQVQVDLDRRGLVLYVTSGVLFDSGEATLTPVGDELLKRLGPVLSPMSNELVVEGHTDSAPISSVRFPSNWELSASRATAVLRHLVDKDGIEAKRMSASGFADTRPRASNATASGMSQNRRVDIVVVAPPEAPAAKAPAAKPASAEKAPAEEGASEGH